MCLLTMEKRVLSVLFSMSDNVRGEYAEESLGVKKVVNEIQIATRCFFLKFTKAVLRH